MTVGQRSERLRDEFEALAQLADGMTIAIGEPAPMAMVRHIIRRGRLDVQITACKSPGFASYSGRRWPTCRGKRSAGVAQG